MPEPHLGAHGIDDDEPERLRLDQRAVVRQRGQLVEAQRLADRQQLERRALGVAEPGHPPSQQLGQLSRAAGGIL